MALSSVNMTCKTARRLAKRMVAQGDMDAAQVNRFTSKLRIKANQGLDGVYELYVNSILSGPITHAVNIGSNAILTTWLPTQQFVEGASAFARRDFDKASADFAKGRKMFAGLMEGVGDMFRLYGKENRGKGMTGLGYDKSIDIAAEKLKARHKPAIGMEGDDLLAGAVNKLGAFVRLPGNVLQEEDKWFKMIHYRMHTNSAAMEKAMMHNASNGGKMTRQQIGNMYNFHRINPDQLAIDTAKDLGEYYTFTNQLEKHGRKGSSWIRGTPGMRYMFPFINTPTNIVKMGLNHGMYGNLTKDLKVALGKGVPAAERDAAIAKIAMGSLVPATIVGMLDEDRITGRIDMATQVGRFKHSQGKPEYSIRAGDTWYSYEKIEPFRSIVGLYVTFKDAMTNIRHFDPDSGEPNELIDKIAFAGIAPVLQTITDNYMMNEIGGVMEILNAASVGNPDSFLETFQKVGANMTVASGVRQANNVFFDGAYRQADGYIESVMAGIPGLSKTLPIRRTLWGDEQHHPEGLFADIISPVYTASVKQDEVDRHMIDLEVDIPGVPRYVSFPLGQGQDPVRVKLTPQQRETYAIVRGKGVGSNQPTLKDVIAQTYVHPDYQNSSEMDQRMFLGNIISDYQSIANDVVKDMPEVVAEFHKNLAFKEAERRRTQPQ